MPVVPATQEAEAGESLEPRRQRLQWADIVPLHSSLGNRVRLCLLKKKLDSSPLLAMVNIVWKPQGMPETTDSAKPNI